MRRNQHAALMRRYLTLMGEYNQYQLDHQEAQRSRIKRQGKILLGKSQSMSDAEAEKIMNERGYTIFDQVWY